MNTEQQAIEVATDLDFYGPGADESEIVRFAEFVMAKTGKDVRYVEAYSPDDSALLERSYLWSEYCKGNRQ